MKSICIKTNNSENINYLLDLLYNTKQSNVCFSSHNFKHYKNIIVHYVGTSVSRFIANISEILSFLVINNFEDNIIKRIIFTNYFYFDEAERNIILEICLELLYENNDESMNERKNILINSFYDYLTKNKQIILDGFINFRLKKYVDFLNSVVDTAVNKFIIEREYIEFISLLKVYINSETSSTEYVHLIYTSNQSILLDKDKNIIKKEEGSLNSKYLSDITFSSNDYTLNTLLNLLPQKIYIHLVEKNIDEFINTLQLVFENRIQICTDCSVCDFYKNSKHINKI